MGLRAYRFEGLGFTGLRGFTDSALGLEAGLCIRLYVHDS